MDGENTFSTSLRACPLKTLWTLIYSLHTPNRLTEHLQMMLFRPLHIRAAACTQHLCWDGPRSPGP